MPYDLYGAAEEAADKYFGERFSARRCADARAYINRHGSPNQLADNERASNKTIHINDVYKEFGPVVDALRKPPNGLLAELREYTI